MPPLASALCRTLSVEAINAPRPDLAPCIIAFWHGLMFAPWWAHRFQQAIGLVSTSKDGVILSAVLKRWGYHLSRGSSSTAGPEALAEMVAAVEMGHTLLITPDGPRGPARQMKRGALLVSQRTQRPLILLGVSYSRAHRLRNWDRFAIPYPFSHVRLTYSDPMIVPPDLSGEPFDAAVAAAGRQLDELTGEGR
jgi:lysophospholipid acyltransferase (LPLAT)-like uncharacterized protein